MSFGLLAVLVAAGLAGPLLSALPRFGPPLVVGELVAGVLLGRSVLDVVPHDDDTLRWLGEIGFALLMLLVGTHLPLRDPRLRASVRRSVTATLVLAAAAALAGVVLAPVSGLHRPGVLAVLVGTSSAAVALPVLASLPGDRPEILAGVGWIALADIASVLAIPLVLPTVSLARVLVGAALVAVSATAVYLLAHAVRDRALVAALRARSRDAGWALDLRVSLLVLFALAWLATRNGASVLLAGFAGGAVLSLLGEPRRLAMQLIGLGEGFLVPLFFVTLGARLDVAGLWQHPRNLVLLAVVAGAAVGVHVLTAALCRLPVGLGLLASAQLGVPAAVVNIGLANGKLAPGQGAAIVGGVLASLVACSVGAALLGHPAHLGSGSTAPRLVERLPWRAGRG